MRQILRSKSALLQLLSGILQVILAISSFLQAKPQIVIVIEGAESMTVEVGPPSLVAPWVRSPVFKAAAGVPPTRRSSQHRVVKAGDLIVTPVAPTREEETAQGPMLREFLPLEDGEAVLFVLTHEYSWLIGQSGRSGDRPQIVHHGRPVEGSEVIRYLRWPELRRQLEQATDVVSVGMASCEGESITEFHRAGRRAEQILHWLRTAYPGDPFPDLHLYTLNLGRFARACPGAGPEETQYQRRIVLLAVHRARPERTLDNQDLLRAMAVSRVLRLNPGDYEAAALGPRGPF